MFSFQSETVGKNRPIQMGRGAISKKTREKFEVYYSQSDTEARVQEDEEEKLALPVRILPVCVEISESGEVRVFFSIRFLYLPRAKIKPSGMSFRLKGFIFPLAYHFK
jgi:hypothetical protein